MKTELSARDGHVGGCRRVRAELLELSPDICPVGCEESSWWESLANIYSRWLRVPFSSQM